MKTKTIKSGTIAVLLVVLFLLTGCTKDNRYYAYYDPESPYDSTRTDRGGAIPGGTSCPDWIRNLWMISGDISTKDYNSTADVRSYYLHNRDSVSWHRYDGANIKVWGYRFVGRYNEEPYYDSVTGEPVIIIALAPRPLRYGRYSEEGDPDSRFYYVHPDSTVVYSGDLIFDDNIRPLTDTIHAFVRGEEMIRKVLENPDKKLLMEGTIDAIQTRCIWWYYCNHLPDCSVGLNITNLTITE